MMRIQESIVVALLFLASVGLAAPAGGAIETYIGDPQMPDEIAFDSFMAMLNGAREQSAQTETAMLGRALGLDPSREESKARLAEVARTLEETYERMQLAKDRDGYAVMCSGNTQDVSAEKAAARMDALDDAEWSVKTRFLQIVLNSLTSSESAAFMAHLNSMKSGISYARISSEAFYADADMPIQDALQSSCANFARKFAEAGG